MKTVAVVGLTAGISKADGRVWDGPGGDVVAEATRTEFVQALSAADPRVAVAAVLAGPAATAIEPPDVAGSVDLFAGGSFVGRLDLEKRPDTFTPQWSGVQWTGVNTADARLRLTLWDADLTANDDMGIVEISAAEIQAAAAASGTYDVAVASQSSNQIAFVKISVM